MTETEENVTEEETTAVSEAAGQPAAEDPASPAEAMPEPEAPAPEAPAEPEEQLSPKDARLLDVGAGTGDFLKLAASHFAVAAVEPSEHLARRLGERIQCPLHVGPFETYTPAEKFDAIVMIDIIEHAADPRGLLNHARDLLKPGGLLFIATVDSQSLLYRMSPLIWRASAFSQKAAYVLRRIYCYQHNWYFNRAVLGSIVSRAGFNVVEHRGYEFPLNRLRESAVILLGLRAIYAAQAVWGANTEQYLLAARPA